MPEIKELSEKFEVLKPPSTYGQPTQEGRVSQRDIISGALTDRLMRAVYVKEVWLQGHPQYTDSWTVEITYQDIVGSINSINFDDFPDHRFYFEMIGFTNAGTGYWRLYNVTDSEVMANSEITTTSTGVGVDATFSERIRSNAIPKPSGTKVIKIQHYISGGDESTEYVNSVMSRLVFRLP